MPVDFIMVRHGESEGNLMSALVKEDPGYILPDGWAERHDSLLNLSELGRSQAVAAGDWLRAHNLGGPYSRYYSSPHSRACQTAGLLGLDGQWRKDDRWRERDWGEYGIVNDDDRDALFKMSKSSAKAANGIGYPPVGSL